MQDSLLDENKKTKTKINDTNSKETYLDKCLSQIIKLKDEFYQIQTSKYNFIFFTILILSILSLIYLNRLQNINNTQDLNEYQLIDNFNLQYLVYSGWIGFLTLFLSFTITKVQLRESDSDPVIARISTITHNFLKSYQHTGDEQTILDTMLSATDKTQLQNVQAGSQEKFTQILAVMTNQYAFMKFAEVDDTRTPDEMFNKFRNSLSTQEKSKLNGTQKLWDQIKENFTVEQYQFIKQTQVEEIIYIEKKKKKGLFSLYGLTGGNIQMWGNIKEYLKMVYNQQLHSKSEFYDQTNKNINNLDKVKSFDTESSKAPYLINYLNLNQNTQKLFVGTNAEMFFERTELFNTITKMKKQTIEDEIIFLRDQVSNHQKVDLDETYELITSYAINQELMNNMEQSIEQDRTEDSVKSQLYTTQLDQCKAFLKKKNRSYFHTVKDIKRVSSTFDSTQDIYQYVTSLVKAYQAPRSLSQELHVRIHSLNNRFENSPYLKFDSVCNEQTNITIVFEVFNSVKQVSYFITNQVHLKLLQELDNIDQEFNSFIENKDQDINEGKTKVRRYHFINTPIVSLQRLQLSPILVIIAIQMLFVSCADLNILMNQTYQIQRKATSFTTRTSHQNQETNQVCVHYENDTFKCNYRTMDFNNDSNQTFTIENEENLCTKDLHKPKEIRKLIIGKNVVCSITLAPLNEILCIPTDALGQCLPESEVAEANFNEVFEEYQISTNVIDAFISDRHICVQKLATSSFNLKCIDYTDINSPYLVNFNKSFNMELNGNNSIISNIQKVQMTKVYSMGESTSLSLEAGQSSFSLLCLLFKDTNKLQCFNSDKNAEPIIIKNNVDSVDLSKTKWFKTILDYMCVNVQTKEGLVLTCYNITNGAVVKSEDDDDPNDFFELYDKNRQNVDKIISSRSGKKFCFIFFDNTMKCNDSSMDAEGVTDLIITENELTQYTILENEVKQVTIYCILGTDRMINCKADQDYMGQVPQVPFRNGQYYGFSQKYLPKVEITE